MSGAFKMRRKSRMAQTYTAFFAVASFFVEGAMAARPTQLLATRQGPNIPVSPGLSFNSLPNATTCEPYTFTWTADGDDYPISINVTNSGVAQEPSATSTTNSDDDHDADDNTEVARAVPTGVTPIPIVTMVVAQSITLDSMHYQWPSVNVAQGWYQLIALIPATGQKATIQSKSDSFFVNQGSDTSCLTSSPGTSATTDPSTTSATPTTSGTSKTGTSSTPPPTIVLPVGGAATSSSSARVGLIVGVTFGIVGFVVIALSACLWLYRRKQRSKISASHLPRRWNGLGSTDSRGGFMANPGNNSSRRQQGASIGTLPMSPSEEAVSKAEKYSIHSQSPFDDSNAGMALATLPVLQQRSRSGAGVARTYSMSSSISNGLSPNEYGNSAGSSPTPGRQSSEVTGYPPSSPTASSPSSGYLGRNSALFIPVTDLSRSHSLSTSATHQTSMMGHLGNTSPSTSSHAGLLNQASYSLSQQQQVSSPISTVSPSDTGSKQVNRRSLGGKRKPVPAYNAADETDGSSAPPVPSVSSTPLSPSPNPDYTPHYHTRNQAGQDHSQPELVHKSSFGPGGVEGKPLHYLIPDMPMSLKD